MNSLLAGAALGLAAVCASAQAQQFYHLDAAATLKGAAPDWDHVTLDPARGYLFIGRRHDGVTVFDVNSQKVVRNIDRSEDANTTVLVPEFDRGYTINEDGTTTVFHLSTLESIDRIKVGENADAAFYDPATRQLVFTMGDSKKVAFVNAGTGKMLGELPMDSKKLEGTVPDGDGNLFMAIRDRNLVVRIDAAQRKLTGQWSTAPCEEPTSIAFDRAGQRIFVGCRGKSPMLAVLDSGSGKLVTTLEIGRGNDGVIYDGTTHKIYTSNGVDANLVIYDQVNPDTYKLSEATTTRPYARTMDLDPKTKKVYLVTAEGTADPARKINKAVAPFYPNHYFPDTFTVLTYSPR
jgi:DNA-binding beta-propeller fold protein YncE